MHNINSTVSSHQASKTKFSSFLVSFRTGYTRTSPAIQLSLRHTVVRKTADNPSNFYYGRRCHRTEPIHVRFSREQLKGSKY